MEGVEKNFIEEDAKHPIGLNRYEQIDAHIGQGTYGKVEKARDRLDGEYVRTKRLMKRRERREELSYYVIENIYRLTTTLQIHR